MQRNSSSSSGSGGYKRARSRSRSRERERERERDVKRARTADRYDSRDSKGSNGQSHKESSRRFNDSSSRESHDEKKTGHASSKNGTKKEDVKVVKEEPKEKAKVVLEPVTLVEPLKEEVPASREARRARWQTIKSKQPVTEPNVPSQTSGSPKSETSAEEMNPQVASSGVEEKPSIAKPVDMFDTSTDSEDEADTEAKLKHHSHVRHSVDASDDNEGYYRPQLGEILHNRYRIIGYYGKGVFSNVLRAKCLTSEKDFAIKLLRNNEYMKRAGKGEVKILELLTNGDPEGKCNTVRLHDYFVEREHLCLVFEAMDMNLRSLLKKYGKNVGLGLLAVRIMAFKILKALALLKANNIIHCDLKPDNMLVSQDRSEVKVADFGSACMSNEEIIPTPLLVSRYYRAPEIILGHVYGPALDMFSFGACLYEFATGKILLRSKDNNDHLKLLLEIKGIFPKKFLTQGAFAHEHFDPNGRFLEHVKDIATGKDIARALLFNKPTRNITEEILDSFSDCNATERELVSHLADLVHKCLTILPEQRITPEEALQHPFFAKSAAATTTNTNSTPTPAGASATTSNTNTPTTNSISPTKSL
jgi:serine/threonine-protein kinase PRP4